MNAPYCAQANDVQGRCRLQNAPTFLSSIARCHGQIYDPLYGQRPHLAPCTPQGVLRQYGYW